MILVFRVVIMLIILTMAMAGLAGRESTLAIFSDTHSMGGNTFATSSDFPPAAPTTLSAIGGVGEVSLDWADNSESDLAGYNVYRGTAAEGPYAKINSSLLLISDYIDVNVSQGTTYYYVVTAMDNGANESGYSSEDNATPTN